MENKPLSKQEQEKLLLVLGIIAAAFGKSLLEMGGAHCDFKINGESIENIKQLPGTDITARIELAVKEERYEDAAKLKKLLEAEKHN